MHASARVKIPIRLYIKIVFPPRVFPIAIVIAMYEYLITLHINEGDVIFNNSIVCVYIYIYIYIYASLIKTLVNSLILLRIYYCSSLFINLPLSSISPLNRVIHSSIRTTYNLRIRDHSSTSS